MRESRRRGISLAALGALLVCGVCMLAPALSAAKPPAVDEYTLDFPHAQGDGQTGGSGTSGTDPSALAPSVRAQLDSPGDQVLVAIATDPSLGAVESSLSGGSNGQGDRGASEAAGRGIFAAAAGALTDTSVLPLLLGLIAIVVLAVAAARRRTPAG